MAKTKIVTTAAVSLFLILIFVFFNQVNFFEKIIKEKQTENVKEGQFSYIKEYPLPDGSSPNGIMVDDDGFVWVVGSNSRLYKFDPILGKIDSIYVIGDRDEQDLSSLMGWTIVQDNDGIIWFSQLGQNPLWRFDPVNEGFTSYSVSASPFQMKLDKKNGDIWFTTLGGDTIGVIQKLKEVGYEYVIKEFDVGENTFPSGLFLKEEHVWITQVVGDKLNKFKINYDAEGLVSSIDKILEIPYENNTRIYSPTDVFVANDGTIWFTEHGTSTISKYQLDENNIKRFPTSRNQFNVTTLPFWIKESQKDDGMWINEHTGNKIAFFNTTEMSLVEYTLPSGLSEELVVYPLSIFVTPKNDVWFSEWNTNKIGFINSEKQIPFDIIVNVTNFMMPTDSEGKQTAIDIKVISRDLLDENLHVSLTASSSMEPTLGFVNMTATFTKERIFLTGINDTKDVQLLITTKSAPLGNYTLAISATDGLVTKSVFADITIG